MSYVGKAVTILAKDRKYASDGVYIVLHDDGVMMNLIGAKVGWEGQYTNNYRHDDLSYVKVIENFDMEAHIKRQRDWADAPKRGGKLQYIESVYSNAHAMLDLLEDVLGKTKAAPSTDAATSKKAVFKHDVMTVLATHEGKVWIKDSDGNTTVINDGELVFI